MTTTPTTTTPTTTTPTTGPAGQRRGRTRTRAATRIAATMAMLLLAGLSLGACSKTDTGSGVTGAGAPTPAAADPASSTGSDTVDLVDAALTTPVLVTASGSQGNGIVGPGDRRRLRARLVHTLHATWVTQGQDGTVTHQAIRGDVTSVSSASITVRAKDGVSLTFTVTGDTRVRERHAGTGTDSSIDAVAAGQKALVVGTGATDPVARLVVFKVAAPTPSASPGATS
jgi:hypothetical protein